MPSPDSQVEQPEGMEKEARILHQLAQIPAPTAAWIGEHSAGGNLITVQYAQRDLGANKLRKYIRTFQLPSDLDADPVEVAPSFPVELRDIVLHSVSPSGRKQFIVRTGKDVTVLELWAGGRLACEVEVPKALHGAVFNDNWFGTGAAWTADENRIAYVAEEAAASKTPDWGVQATPRDSDETAKEAEKGSKPPKAAPKSWRGIGEFKEDWGELNTGKGTPRLFVFDIASASVEGVKGTPPESSVGQPVWDPDAAGLVFVAWPHKSLNFPKLTQRLGIVYCVNRPCFMYHIKVLEAGSDAQEAEAEKLDTGLQSGFCPQFSPDGKSLVFMSHDAAVTSGAHCATVTLESLPWPARGPRHTLIDIVDDPEDVSSFPGLYSFLLSRTPFAFLDDDRLLLTSHWRSFLRILEVRRSVDDSKQGAVEPVSPIEHPTPSYILLAAKHGLVVAARSGPSRPPTLSIARTGTGSLQWCSIAGLDSPDPEVEASLNPNRETYKLLQVPSTVGLEGKHWEGIMLFNRQGNKQAPTVLTPHGGPHSGFVAAYVLSNTFLTLLGYNVLLINYRGSLGFGEASVQSLPGNIGTNDVADCIASLDEAVAQGHTDSNKVAVIGGSHGGFLAGHLVGQHPQRFKAAVFRNPVLDIALMSQLSDIPDWCFIEGFGSKEGMQRASVKPSLEEVIHLNEISPIRHINQVEAPLLFLLGAKDRRVVMKDAHQYVAALKARDGSPEARVLVFPEDAHGLEQPQTEFEQWLNAAWWLKRFL